MGTILNIANNYFGTAVFNNIYEAQRQLGLQPCVLVFLPEQDADFSVGEDITILWEPRSIHFFLRFLPFLRFFYHRQELLRFLKFREISLIHSHTIHSNGSLGYFIAKMLKVPHVVSVRNTDVNDALPKLFFLKKWYWKVLHSCTSIVCPNFAYQEFIWKRFHIQPIVMPNPIDAFWLENNNYKSCIAETSTIKILVIGEIVRNKNQLSVVEAANAISQNTRVILAGKVNDEQYLQEIENAATATELLTLGEISDKSSLLQLLNDSHLMCLVSFKETFGLSIVESALSGVPTVFTRNQAIDGYFPDGAIGVSVDPHNKEELQAAIKSTLAMDRQNIRRLALERFSRDRYLSELRRLYV